MDRETLSKAKELEADIQKMKDAVTYHKRGQWSSWDIMNDSSDSFHFEFCKNWSGKSFDRVDLPTWLNDRLMAVVKEEMHRCEQEFENLGNGQADGAMERQGVWQPMQPLAYTEGDRVQIGGAEYEYHRGQYVPTRRLSWLERWYSLLPFVIIILDVIGVSWVCVRYWETVRSYYDTILAVDCIFVITLTVFIMIRIETYIENKRRGRQ